MLLPCAGWDEIIRLKDQLTSRMGDFGNSSRYAPFPFLAHRKQCLGLLANLDN